MKFVGNYADIIKDEWITYLLDNSGKLLPTDKMDAFECNDHYAVVLKQWKIEDMATWHKFEIEDLNFTIPWPVTLTDSIDWWVIKQSPGQCIPMHIDDNPPDKTTRYVLMFQDYIPGHVLIWNGKLLSDYKKGDLFIVDDVNANHGSSNISNTPRLLAHLTVWN
jgi:hypothetical protein